MLASSLFADLRAFKTCAGLLLKGILKGFESLVHLLNVYGPYSNRMQFWDRANSSGLLSLPNLLLACDLNFTWSVEEVYGSGRSSDPLSDFFHSLFYEAHLVDIAMVILSSA